MTRIAKQLATDITLIFAAGIGALLFLTLIGAIHQHPTLAMQPAPTTAPAGVVVPCNTYLSHAAMTDAQVYGAGPATTHSFCAVTGPSN